MTGREAAAELKVTSLGRLWNMTELDLEDVEEFRQHAIVLLEAESSQMSRTRFYSVSDAVEWVERFDRECAKELPCREYVD